MKIALIGYGKMGRQIEKLAHQRGHEIIARIGSSNWDDEKILQADLCIEFTSPESAVENIKKLARLKKDIVVGTTGWYDQLPEIEQLASVHQIGILHGPNFAIGIHLFLQILEQASQLMNFFPEFDAAGIEYHHNQKKDSPSGIAKTMGALVERNMERSRPFPFASVRCGSIPGTHSILFDSPTETITLTHEARNREGFASGALLAGEWIVGRKGLYSFNTCITDLISKRKHG